MTALMHNWGITGGILRIFLAAALAFGLLATPWMAKPAHACSCAGGLPASFYVERFDTVVVGTGGARHSAPPEIYELSTGAPLILDALSWQFTVETYLKGSGAASIAVESVAQGSACGYVGEVGKRYLLFLRLSDNAYGTGLCNGNADLSTVAGQRWFEEVILITGPGQPSEEAASQGAFNMPLAAGGIVLLATIAAWLNGHRMSAQAQKSRPR